jgi:hypothetical protein
MELHIPEDRTADIDGYCTYNMQSSSIHPDSIGKIIDERVHHSLGAKENRIVVVNVS